MTWNFGDLLDALAEVLPADAPALLLDDDTRSWGINANARLRGTVSVTIPACPGGSM